MTPDRAAIETALASAGVRPTDILQIDPRNGRTAVHLTGDRLAWFPHHDEGQAHNGRERRVLRVLETYCGFKAPRIIYEDRAGWDVRALVPGVVEPFALFERLRADPGAAAAIGDQLGRILAEQHTAVPVSELEGWLPSEPNWPDAQDVERVSEVAPDPALLSRIDAARALYDRRWEGAGRPVLVHGDVGVHNVAMDPTGLVAGVFDYEGAALGDRSHDFKYLLLHATAPGGDAMLEAAIAAYEPLTGVAVDRRRVRLLNAMSAIGFLGFRRGHAPDENWCGRTLAEDLDWTTSALDGLGL